MSKFSAGNTRASRLSAEQVHSIRTRYAAGTATQRQLSIEFNVSITTISNIIHGLTWQNAPMVESEEEKEHKLASSQRALEKLLSIPELVDPAVEAVFAEREQKPAPKPVSDNARDLASLMEGLRKRKADLVTPQTEETRNDEHSGQQTAASRDSDGLLSPDGDDPSK